MTRKVLTRPGSSFSVALPPLLYPVVWLCCFLTFVLSMSDTAANARDLEEVLNSGKLRHLGIPYANFVSGKNSGLDVELMQLFAAHLGVSYEFILSSWGNIIPDLTGKTFRPHGDDVDITGNCDIRGDVIATGFTVLPWRQKIIDFATPTFPTGVWLIARADSKLNPVTPTGNINRDIKAVRKGLQGKSVLTLKDSCLDAELYHLGETGATIHQMDPNRDLDEMIPLVIAKTSESTLMDMPVALIALEKWPGEIKVIGPVSEQQQMAPAFAKSSPNLRRAFEIFFAALKADGTYNRLVTKYYPTVLTYYPVFFKNEINR